MVTSMSETLPRIMVLGANGLIGHGVALELRRRGFPIIGAARRFTKAQRAALDPETVEAPLVDFSINDLSRLMGEAKPDIVLNAIGILQDGPHGQSEDVHHGFVGRLLAALPQSTLLIQVSVPGVPHEDRTDFSRTKRAAETLVRAAEKPFVILRPGFVVAPVAYGGSALIRALAALPVALPAHEMQAPFAATSIQDITDTVDLVARRWAVGHRQWAATWDILEARPGTLGDVIAGVRRHIGGPKPRWTMPSWLMDIGAKAGDLASYLGWQPPIRSTALAELRRGVVGDPNPWSAATGLSARSLRDTLAPVTIQEQWFARLYLLKGLIIASLVVFWLISGLIALTVAFNPARDILLLAGFPHPLATVVTVVSSMTDIGVGVLIALRRTCKIGLIAGVGVSLFYMAGAAILTPQLWIEPLGALVKTGPAIVLMLVAWAILSDRP
jgi:nucleoside-diphosphate-sugar epimerase